MKQTRLSTRLVWITLLTLLMGVGIVVNYFLLSQNRVLLLERENAVEQQVAILYQSIKNNMLTGTATNARSLFRDLKTVPGINEIVLFRANGQEAFSDNTTVEQVNQALGGEYFRPAPVQGAYITDTSEPLRQAVRSRTQQTLEEQEGGIRLLVYYVPLLNGPACQRCHNPALSLDPDVRGVLRVVTSMGDVDRQLQRNVLVAALIWVGIVAALTLILLASLERVVLRPLRAIGSVVEQVTQGNLEARVVLPRHDEIGLLGQQINRMIQGLRERFKLSKFVSQATLEVVSSEEALALGGEKLVRAVLFSDIRGFTAYAEQHDPQEVLDVLNRYLQVQAAVILQYQGDVDQFIGDQVFGVFRGVTMAQDALGAALTIREAVSALASQEGLPLRVGIGLHLGPLVEGNLGVLGEVQRLQRTVIGDTVNVGARLCAVAEAGEILMSETLREVLGTQVLTGSPRVIQIKGKTQPVTVYPVLGWASLQEEKHDSGSG